MSNFISWLQQLRFGAVWEMLIVLAASLLCITVHESCHGLAAYWLGDDTARRRCPPRWPGCTPTKGVPSWQQTLTRTPTSVWRWA